MEGFVFECVSQMRNSVSDRTVNIVGKGGNADLPAFSPFPTRLFFPRSLKRSVVLEKVTAAEARWLQRPPRERGGGEGRGFDPRPRQTEAF